MPPPSLRLTLRRLRPEELLPLWCFVDSLEQTGQISAAGSLRWKDGIYESMIARGLRPEEIILAEEGGSRSPRVSAL
jgi:hypothetical protein